MTRRFNGPQQACVQIEPAVVVVEARWARESGNKQTRFTRCNQIPARVFTSVCLQVCVFMCVRVCVCMYVCLSSLCNSSLEGRGIWAGYTPMQSATNAPTSCGVTAIAAMDCSHACKYSGSSALRIPWTKAVAVCSTYGDRKASKPRPAPAEHSNAGCEGDACCCVGERSSPRGRNVAPTKMSTISDGQCRCRRER